MTAGAGGAAGESALLLTAAALHSAYASGRLTPLDVVEEVLERIAARGADAVWIHQVPAAELRAAAEALVAEYGGFAPELPLFGLPYAVKDNIDVAGLPTTAACPDFAYVAETDAEVVSRLRSAGALLVGKLNLDQFATGLVGTRSPYGLCVSPFDERYVSGGSSSGSALAVAVGEVTFAIGTDTAGSGRVPAAFTNTVGVKPTRGLVSTAGIVPACRSLDCPSVFALTVDDGARVLEALGGPPAPVRAVSLAGLRVAVPEPAALELSAPAAAVWHDALIRLATEGAVLSAVDTAAMTEAGSLLYGGPYLAERLSGLADFVRRWPASLHPVTRTVLERGERMTAVEAFQGLARVTELTGLVRETLGGFDVLLTPTVQRAVTVEEALSEPLASNEALGRWTTFANVVDLACVAVPGGFGPDGLPYGVTFSAPAGSDALLAGVAASWETLLALPLGATGVRAGASSGWATDALARAGADAWPAAPPGRIPLAVVGAHLKGQPLHPMLLSFGATLLDRTTTAPAYRLYALAGGPPARPGLARDSNGGGAAIEVEVYALPPAGLGSLLATVPPPLAIGSVELSDGSWVQGFVCEPYALTGAREITDHGGWRAYLAIGSAP